MNVEKGERVDKSNCDRHFKPQRREQCFVRNCLPSNCAELKAQNAGTENVDGNYTVLVAGYRIQVYCHQMNETLPKTYLNVDPRQNFAEFYGKRLLYPHTCPQNGQRNDSCECTDDGHSSAGRTEFSKLRVDLQNMKINRKNRRHQSKLQIPPVQPTTSPSLKPHMDSRLRLEPLEIVSL